MDYRGTMLTANRTGQDGEQIVGTLLSQQSHYIFRQVKSRSQIESPADYIPDFLIHEPGGTKIVIEVKTRIKSGSCEEIVTETLLRLQQSIANHPSYRKAYLVMLGDGWSDRYRARLQTRVSCDKIAIVNLDQFFNLVRSETLGN